MNAGGIAETHLTEDEAVAGVDQCLRTEGEASKGERSSAQGEV